MSPQETFLLLLISTILARVINIIKPRQQKIPDCSEILDTLLKSIIVLLMNNKTNESITEKDAEVKSPVISLNSQIKHTAWISKSIKAERLKVELVENGIPTRFSIFAFADITRMIQNGNQRIKFTDIVPIILRDGRMELLDKYREDKNIKIIDEKYDRR